MSETGSVFEMDITYPADCELPVVQGRRMDLDQNLLWPNLVYRKCSIWLIT